MRSVLLCLVLLPVPSSSTSAADLRAVREEVIKSYNKVYAAQPFNFTHVDEVFTRLLCEDVQLFTNLVGNWKPRPDVIEYLSASFFEVNGGVFSFKNRTVNQDGVQWSEDGRIAHYIEGSEASFFLPSGFAIEIPFHNIVEFTFSGTCIQIMSDTITEPTLTLSKVGIAEESAEDICSVIRSEEYCGPERCHARYGNCTHQRVIPFNSTSECVSFYNTLPARCADNSHTSRGNNKACRMLHRHLVGIGHEQALTHCVHTGPHSEGMCRNADCPHQVYCKDPQCIVRGTCVENHDFSMTCDWDESVSSAIAHTTELVDNMFQAVALLGPRFYIPLLLLLFVGLLCCGSCCWCIGLKARQRLKGQPSAGMRDDVELPLLNQANGVDTPEASAQADTPEASAAQGGRA